MPSLAIPNAALALELMGLTFAAGLLWLGASLRSEAAKLDGLRQAALAASVVLIATGLWWPAHAHLGTFGPSGYVALLAALLLPLPVAALAADQHKSQSKKKVAWRSTLVGPLAVACSVTFVVASSADSMLEASPVHLGISAVNSLALVAALTWLLGRSSRRAPARIAAALAAAVVVSLIEWAPTIGLSPASQILRLVASLAALAGGVAMLRVFRRSHTEVAAALAQKEREAIDTDPLTRLATRRSFEQRLTAAVAQAHQDRAPLVLLFVDLDGFKAVNDSYGHTQGDAVIVEMTQRLRNLVKPSDILARVGADAFLILTRDDAELAAAEVQARRIVAALGRPYELSPRPVSLTGSVGIVRYPKHGPADQLIARADAAAQAAKQAGGNRHRIYNRSMDTGARERLAMTGELRAAVERGELELYYQPKVDTASLQITGAEALLHWNHPQQGVVSPGVFIPLAEQSGLIEPIGNWIIEEACRQIGAWRDVGLKMRVAINLSALQLAQDDFVPRLMNALRKHRIEPSLLTCEVTETIAMSDTANTQAAMKALGDAGMHVSIDDFGTGYSSLSYLRRLPAEELKIDRSFISDLETSTDARAIADAVIKLAHALGLRVVAEGVETEAQAKLLARLGCNQLQGYLYGKPMPAPMLLEWALDRRKDGGTFRPSLFTEEPVPT